MAGRITTVPIGFHNGSRSGFVPAESAAYTPTCHTEGIACEPGELADAETVPAAMQKDDKGACRCANGALITTHLPCRMVCPKR